MIAREEARKPMKRRVALPVIAVVLACLWMVLPGLGAEDYAELAVTKIVLDPPSTVSRGQEVEVYARVMNTGARSADGFNISFFYRHTNSAGNWTLHETITEVSLPPSHQDFYEVIFYLATIDLDLGTYDLRIVADSSNHISETDELNNELRTTMTLRDSSLGLPDLQPVSLAYAHTNPSALDDMEPWNVTTQVRNLGEVQAGQFVVAFFVDGEEFARQIRFVLPPDGVTDVTAELDPQGLALAPGTHRVSVVVDPEDAAAEQNEGNNTVSGSLTLQSVELVPTSLVFDRSVVRLDEEIRVTAQLRNDGEGVAKGVEVAFYAGHVRFATAEVDILGRGMSATVDAILDPEKAGLEDAPADYEIRVAIDPNDTLHEFDEANNEMRRTLTILPSETKKAEVHPESIELTPASPAEQGRTDAVTVTSVIKNTGRASAESFDVAFHYRVKGALYWKDLDCVDASSCRALTLPPGAQARLVGRLNVIESFLPAGIYEVRVVVDASDSTDELDETNNELVTTLTLLASRRPDLLVSIDAIEPASAVQRGQTARVVATIRNIGEQPADASIVRFSYCRLTELATPAAQQAACSDGFQTRAVLPDAELAIPALGIGESTTVRVNVETAHSNNVVTAGLAVLGPDLLAVPGSLLANPAGTVDQTTADRIAFELVILNSGPEAAGAFEIGFELLKVVNGSLETVRGRDCGDTGFECADPAFFGVVQLPGIGAGAQQRVSCALDLAGDKLDEGQYIVRAHIDSMNQVHEHIEINNTIETLVAIVGEGGENGGDIEADLSVDVAGGRAKVHQIAAYGLITNVGTQDAGPFSVEIVITLPSGQSLRRVEMTTSGLPSGETMTIGVQLWHGTDFAEGLTIDDEIGIVVRILGDDGNLDNNVGATTVDVKGRI